MNSERHSAEPSNFGTAWVFLCLAFCAHVADEALTGFLPVYNASVQVMRSEYATMLPAAEPRPGPTGMPRSRA